MFCTFPDRSVYLMCEIFREALEQMLVRPVTPREVGNVLLNVAVPPEPKARPVAISLQVLIEVQQSVKSTRAERIPSSCTRERATTN